MAALISARIKRDTTSDGGTLRVADTYRVVCEPGDDELAAVTFLAVVLYDPHPTYPLARAKSLDVSTPGDEGWVFDLKYSYDTEPYQSGVSGGQDPSQLPPSSDPAASDGGVSPELRPWVFQYGAVSVSEPMEYDTLGNPLQNSLAEKFVPTLEIERPRRVMRLTCWMPITFDAQGKADLYQGTVNGAAWGRYAAAEALCTSYVPTTERIQDVDVWRIEIEVVISRNRNLGAGRVLGAWQPVWLPNRGTKAFFTLPVAGDVILPVLDREGRPVKDPVYIRRSDGKVATQDDIDTDAGPNNADLLATDLHIPFYPYEATNFANMLTP